MRKIFLLFVMLPVLAFGQSVSFKSFNTNDMSTNLAFPLPVGQWPINLRTNPGSTVYNAITSIVNSSTSPQVWTNTPDGKFIYPVGQPIVDTTGTLPGPQISINTNTGSIFVGKNIAQDVPMGLTTIRRWHMMSMTDSNEPSRFSIEGLVVDNEGYGLISDFQATGKGDKDAPWSELVMDAQGTNSQNYDSFNVLLDPTGAAIGPSEIRFNTTNGTAKATKFLVDKAGNTSIRGNLQMINDTLYTWPATNGSASQALVTDGNTPQQLSWATVGGAQDLWRTNTVDGGIWWSNVNGNAKFGPRALGTFVSGFTNATGKIVSTGIGDTALGYADGPNSLILSEGQGSIVAGKVTSGGELDADAWGSIIFGYATGTGSLIYEDGNGGVAFGNTLAGGVIEGDGNGSLTFGIASGASSTIKATANGALAGGNADAAGTIRASQNGALAFGRASGGTVSATVAGAVAEGEGNSGGIVTATSEGAHAFGVSDTGARLQAAQVGTMASGDTTLGGEILANAVGAHVLGFATATNSLMQCDIGGGLVAGAVANQGILYAHAGAGWEASFVLGYATGSGSRIDANGPGALAGGMGTNGWQTSAGGPASFTWGENVGNDTAVGFAQAFGEGYTNTASRTFNVGWGRQQFIIDTNIVTVNGNVAYSTNLITGAQPDFYLGSMDFVTNNVAHLLAPINVNPNKWETCAVAVTNSTASAVAITIAGNVHVQGTLFVTNLTILSYTHDGNKWTNCVSYAAY